MKLFKVEKRKPVAMLAGLAFLAFLLPGWLNQFAYGLTEKARTTTNRDSELAAAEKASQHDPQNAQYMLRLYRARFEAAQSHMEQGIKHLRQHEYQPAIEEFETALRIDPSCMVARQELEFAKSLRAAEAPAQAPSAVATQTPNPVAPVPSPSPTPPAAHSSDSGSVGFMDTPPTIRPLSRESLSLQLHEDARIVFRTIGKLAGLNVIFDPEFPENKKIHLELENVTIQQALQVACVEAKAFWKPVTSNTILVLPDTAAKRRQEEEQVLKKIYLQHTQSAQELTEITSSLQQMLELRHVQAIARDNAILIRDTPNKVQLAERLIRDTDRGRPEVVVQISVLQVRRDKARSLGIQPGGTSTLFFAPTTPLGPIGAVALDKLGHISSGDFALTIPNAVASALISDSSTRIIQNPEVRVSDGESARLRVGDRIPVATGSFQATAGVGLGVNTQFQYIDVGVNIDILPHVLPDHSVSMKLGVEVSSLNGRVNIGGVDQPVISQRRIDHEIRLQEGEVSVLGGLAERSQSKSVTGWPGLSRLPLLRYLFSGEDVTSADNEVLIVVVPKLVRGREHPREALQVFSVGTDGDLMLRQQGETVAPVLSATRQEAAFMEAQAVIVGPGLVQSKDNPPTLRLDPESLSIKTGEKAIVNVQVENVSDLFSAALLFRYDPHLVSVEDVHHGDFLSENIQDVAIVQRIDNEKGETGIFTTRQPNTAGVTGKGVLLSLVVKRLADGAASIKLAEVGTRTSRQRGLPIKVAKGSVDLP